MYVILPGLFGSKIYCSCDENKPRKLYPKMFGSLENHFFDTNCRTTTKPLKSYFGVSVYRKLEERLHKSGHVVKYFSYDWRKTPLDIAKLCAEFLTRLTDNHHDEEKQNIDVITLIGHSNGGYVLRILFEYLNYPRNEFRHIIIFGTPLFGNLNFNLYNKEFQLYKKLCKHINKIKKRTFMFTANDMSKILKTFKSTLIYFIPTPIFFYETIENLSVLVGVEISELFLASCIHKRLHQMRTQKYIFVYNTSKKMPQTIPYTQQTIRLALQEYPQADAIERNGQLYTHCDGDSVVCSPKIPLKNTIYDTTPLPHSLSTSSHSFFESLNMLHLAQADGDSMV